MLGPWLLVAPVLEPGGRVRVYLPPGRWHDFWGGDVIEGSRWLDITMPIERLPVFVRDDSLLPMGPDAQYVGQHPWSPLEVQVRVSDASRLRVSGEGLDVALAARREGDRIVLDLEGRGELALCWRSPRPSSFEVEGDARGVEEGTDGGTVVVTLRLEGKARLQGR